MRGIRSRGRADCTGFTLTELMVALAMSVIVLGCAVALFAKALDASFMITNRAEMQQNARVALNSLSRDLSLAGAGLPVGGVQLPAGAGAAKSHFACDMTGACYVANNDFPNNHLYGIIPEDASGPAIIGVTTDSITVVYADNTFPGLSQYPLTNVTPSGNQITFDGRTNPPIGDPAVGLKPGDLVMLSNTNGGAIGTITSLAAGGKVNFASNDWLDLNQPGAANGNIAALANPGPPAGNFPQTTAQRVDVITYFLQVPVGAGALPRLMRQVNAQPPAPVAENVENLQFSYDIYDDTTATASSNLPDAGLGAGKSPNQIRAINISVTVRAADLKGAVQRLTLATSVSARDMSFRDRYD
jgi:prepilin-type N-terminal cleavage/methylation domain-containing protein